MPTNPQNMSDAEIWLQLARESLARYGTALPPLVNAGRLPSPAARVAEEPDTTQKKRRTKRQHRKMVGPNKCICPKCKKVKAFPDDFGFRMQRGKETVQSWCSQCRSETSKDYLRRPHVYKVSP